MHYTGDAFMQAKADAYTAVCPEPYSRTRVLAGSSSAAGQDAASETAALGGIAIIDIGTKRLVSKVCLAQRWHSQTYDITRTAQKLCSGSIHPRTPAGQQSVKCMRQGQDEDHMALYISGAARHKGLCLAMLCMLHRVASRMCPAY